MINLFLSVNRLCCVSIEPIEPAERCKQKKKKINFPGWTLKAVDLKPDDSLYTVQLNLDLAVFGLNT